MSFKGSLSRRGVLAAAGISVLGAALAKPALLRGAAFAQTAGGGAPLGMPTVIDARADGRFVLKAIAGETEFAPGVRSPTIGLNQPYLGPVVRVKAGAALRPEVENAVGDSISLHWHGLLIPGEVDGGPHQMFDSGATWRPELTANPQQATLWFHSHAHGKTATQVYSGLAGILYVEDGRDGERGVPANYGVDDLILVLQDKRFDADGRLVYQPSMLDQMHGFLAETILVNGVRDPVATVPAGIVRLRLLNGCNGRNFDVSFEDKRSFSLIATEQGLLAKPVEMERLRLTPGERAEVLVDFGAGGDVRLMSRPHSEGDRSPRQDGGMAAMMAMMGAFNDPFKAPFPLVSFTVDRSAAASVTRMPADLMADLPQDREPGGRRTISLDMGPAMMMRQGGGRRGMMGPDMMGPGMMGHGAMGHGSGMDGNAQPASIGGGMMGRGAGGMAMFGVNGKPFAIDRLDFTVPRGTAELWTVKAPMMGHPFHVHGARFKVVSENGSPPRAENSGWKDTVFVDGEAELLVVFDHPAPAEAAFMLHCHILEHEEQGMMAQFAVT